MNTDLSFTQKETNDDKKGGRFDFSGLKQQKELDLGNIKVRLFKNNEDKEVVDIRQYFKDRPTRKGVRMPLELYNVIKDKF